MTHIHTYAQRDKYTVEVIYNVSEGGGFEGGKGVGGGRHV